MPDHEPFDGSVPFVIEGPPFLVPRRWFGYPANEGTRGRLFATWREAMDYAMGVEQ